MTGCRWIYCQYRRKRQQRCKSFAAELMASKFNFGKRLRVTGHEYRKMDYGAALRCGCSCENRFVSKRWHPSFKSDRNYHFSYRPQILSIHTQTLELRHGGLFYALRQAILVYLRFVTSTSIWTWWTLLVGAMASSRPSPTRVVTMLYVFGPLHGLALSSQVVSCQALSANIVCPNYGTTYVCMCRRRLVKSEISWNA